MLVSFAFEAPAEAAVTTVLSVGDISIDPYR
jgi:hypothetical protein